MARLHRQILRVLVADVASGARKPGERLPSEADLGAEFGVSRGVIREAIRGLEERGLVRVHRRRGTTIAEPRAWDLLDADVAEALLSGPYGHSVLLELVECRRMLEVEAAGLAAERATSADLVALAGALAQMTAAAGRPKTTASEDLFHQADLSFHNAILMAAGNRILIRLTEPIARTLMAARRSLAHPEMRAERGLPEHSRILTAIARRQPREARLAMEAHLSTVAAYVEDSRVEQPHPEGP